MICLENVLCNTVTSRKGWVWPTFSFQITPWCQKRLFFFYSVFLSAPQSFRSLYPSSFLHVHTATPPPSLSLLLSAGSPTTEKERGLFILPKFPRAWSVMCYLALNLYNGQLHSAAIKLNQLQLPGCGLTDKDAQCSISNAICNHIPPPKITLLYFYCFAIDYNEVSL